MARRPSKQKQMERAVVDARIARLTLQGKTVREIGEIVGLSYSAVAKHQREITAMWRQDALEDLSAVKGRHLAELRQVRQAAWESFHLTRGEQTTTQEEDGHTAKGSISRTITRTKNTAGDPSYLNAILVSMQAEAKLLGLNEPDVMAVTDAAKLRNAEKELTNLSIEELRAAYQSGQDQRGEA